jgi:hypothetical protein
VRKNIKWKLFLRHRGGTSHPPHSPVSVAACDTLGEHDAAKK